LVSGFEFFKPANQRNNNAVKIQISEMLFCTRFEQVGEESVFTFEK
jgi:hypothetical protein